MSTMQSADLPCPQAQELITALIDEALSEQERALLELHLAQCRNCRWELELERAQKRYLARRHAPPEPPAELLERVRIALQEAASPPAKAARIRPIRTWAMAAAVAALGFFFLYLFSRGPDTVSARSVSELTLQHFQTTLTRQLPWVRVASREQAWQVIRDRMRWDVRIPPIQHADLVGVWIGPYLPEVEIPVLKYIDRRNGEPIYVFIFAPECLRQHSDRLNVEPEIWRHLPTDQDFYVQEVRGRDVVSWRWRGVFYQAISNHNGHALRALIVPPNAEEG